MSSNIKIQRICQHCGQEFTARTTVTQYADSVRLRESVLGGFIKHVQKLFPAEQGRQQKPVEAPYMASGKFA